MPSFRITRPFFGDGEFDAHVERMKTIEQNPNVTGMFGAVQRLSHVYGGTVDPVTIAHRRRRNKAARRSRRINRLAAKR